MQLDQLHLKKKKKKKKGHLILCNNLMQLAGRRDPLAIELSSKLAKISYKEIQQFRTHAILKLSSNHPGSRSFRMIF